MAKMMQNDMFTALVWYGKVDLARNLSSKDELLAKYGVRWVMVTADWKCWIGRLEAFDAIMVQVILALTPNSCATSEDFHKFQELWEWTNSSRNSKHDPTWEVLIPKWIIEVIFFCCFLPLHPTHIGWPAACTCSLLCCKIEALGMIITCEGDSIKKKDNISFLRTKMAQIRKWPIQTSCWNCCFVLFAVFLSSRHFWLPRTATNQKRAGRILWLQNVLQMWGKPHVCSIKFPHNFPYIGLCNEQIR